MKDRRIFGLAAWEVALAFLVVGMSVVGVTQMHSVNSGKTISDWETAILEAEPHALEPDDVIDMTGRHLDGVDNAPVLFVPLMEDGDEAQWIVCSRQTGDDIRFAEVAQTYKRGIPLPGYDFSGPAWEPLRDHADRICARAGELNEWKESSR